MDTELMRERIITLLKDIESKNDIKILFCSESGSRAWGFESPESDFDVRFIYAHKPEWYFRIDEKPKDNIVEMYDDNLIDINGWELRKAMRLLRKSNPNLIEWINSPIKYICDDVFYKDLVSLSNIFFNYGKTKYHYKSIYQMQDKRYLYGEKYPLKRFLYYLRSILCCEYVTRYNKFPPVYFKYVVNSVVDSQTILNKIYELIELKKTSKENDLQEVDSILVEYANQLADKYNKAVILFGENDCADKDLLDKFVYNTIINYERTT